MICINFVTSPSRWVFFFPNWNYISLHGSTSVPIGFSWEERVPLGRFDVGTAPRGSRGRIPNEPSVNPPRCPAKRNSRRCPSGRVGVQNRRTAGFRGSHSGKTKGRNNISFSWFVCKFNLHIRFFFASLQPPPVCLGVFRTDPIKVRWYSACVTTTGGGGNDLHLLLFE